MKALLRFLFRSPMRAAIICGIFVAVIFGLASFPRPQLSKAVTDWRLEDVILSDANQQQLLAARDAAGEDDLVELTEEEFRARDFAYTASLLSTEGSGRRFVVQYTGADEFSGGPVYVAERQVFAAPWWSPHRFIYRAAEAEINAFGDVLDLTFERDVFGLTGLIVVDALVGLVYGLVVGLIVSVLRNTGLAPTPKRGETIRHQALRRTSPAR